MKKLLVLAAVVAVSWWLWTSYGPKVQRQADAFERYGTSLSKDPQKAEAAADKMNAAIKQDEQTVKDGLEQSGQ